MRENLEFVNVKLVVHIVTTWLVGVRLEGVRVVEKAGSTGAFLSVTTHSVTPLLQLTTGI